MKQKGVPQYYQIYEALRKEILSGAYIPGAMLPFERELCERHGAQRITVRHALQLLVRDGLIYKRPGVGSFVSDPGQPEDAGAPLPAQPPGKSKTVLFIMMRNRNDVHNNSNAYNSQLFFVMEQACRAQGLELLFLPVLYASELSQRLQSDPPICALLVSHIEPEIIKCLLDASIPLVMINSIDRRIVSIMPDNSTGAMLAMGELFSLGHQKIAYIGGSKHYVNAQERYLGYRTAYWTRGLSINPHWIRNGDWTFEGGKDAMRELLSLPADERPTAVFCASDMMALGTYEAIQSAGLKIGRDISVMGFDNVPMCDYVLPHLCSIEVSLDQMTRVASSHMLAAIDGRADANGPYVVRIPASLFRRLSCGPEDNKV